MRRMTCITVALLMSAGVTRLKAEESTWSVGDLFLGVGDGTYHVYDSQGRFKQAIADELGGYTTDCGFSPDLERLYTTNYTNTKVVVYEEGSVLQTIDPAATSPGGHTGSIVFDSQGNFFVGHPDGNTLIHQYGESGLLLNTFDVAVEDRGTNWIDLSSDQATLFYTSEGRYIQRYDTETAAQLSDFAELPDEGHAQAIRLLPPGDGTGGLLVADGLNVKRLDETGRVIQTYDADATDSWFALNLDPNGTSFWSTDQETDQVYRFDIESGRMERTFQAGPGETVFGVCLKGELTAGITQVQSVLPMAYSISQNVPNPFNPSTQISYQLPQAGTVRLEIYNLLGQKIQTLVQGEQTAGVHTATWNGRDRSGRDVSSGIYLYRFVSDGLVETHRMLLLK